MARPRNPVPSFRRHKTTNSAYSDFTDPKTGVRRTVRLGAWGSEEARQAHARLCSEVASGSFGTLSDLSVAELLLRYLGWADGYFRKNGQVTSEVSAIKAALRPVHKLYGLTPADHFGPRELKTVQAAMVESGMSRRTVNAQVNRVRRVWKWAVGESILRPEVLVALSAVAPLREGRTTAREKPPVGPVAEEIVTATLPHLNATVRAMVQLQLFTGMRPNEVVQLRPADVDTTADVWLYKPTSHKNQHHGRQRVIPIGPKAQHVLRPFLPRDPQSHCFSPQEVLADLRERQRAERKKRPVNGGGNRARPKEVPAVVPSELYDVASYRRAITRACDLAFPPPTPLAKRADETESAWWHRLTPNEQVRVKTWRKANRWAPNQLRHTAATTFRRTAGIEAARTVLGHSKLSTTEVYAEADLASAVDLARRVG